MLLILHPGVITAAGGLASLAFTIYVVRHILIRSERFDTHPLPAPEEHS